MITSPKMLSLKTIIDLNKAFTTAPGGFVVVDAGRPKFVVLDYETYRSLKAKEAPPKKRGKILVTGGAGYIGSHVTKILRQRGYEVVVIDDLSTGRREAIQDCKFYEGNVGDRTLLDKIFREEEIAAVLHFAASIEAEDSVLNPARYFENNVLNGLNLLNAMVEHKVSRLIFSSTAAVYGEPETLPITEEAACAPVNPYGESKLLFERMLRWYSEAYGIHSVTLRYFNAGGAWTEAGLGYRIEGRSHLIPRVLEVAAGRSPEIAVYGQDYGTPDGTCIRDYIHVLDLAEAHIAALEKLGTSNGVYVYNIGTGLGHSVMEVIDEAMEITGRMVPIKVSERRPGDPARLVADSTKARRELRWQPRCDLHSILESSWQWHQASRPQSVK